MTVDLDGQVALVTGASSGIGRQMSMVLAASGAKVALVARRDNKLAAVQAAIASAGGFAVPVRADLSRPEAAYTALNSAEELLGTVTILVNCAGIPDAMYATKMPLDLIGTVINTNLVAPFVLAIEVAKRLIAAGAPGRIINVSSMSSFHYVGDGAALYSITKAALNRMTEALAVEWARFHINVNGIAPGAVDTEMMQGMVARVGDMTHGYPRGRMAKPSDLDSTLLFLVDPRSELVTGTVIKVDDGQMPR